MSDGQVIFEIEQDFNDSVIPKILSRLRPDGTFDKPDYTQLSPFLTEKQEEEINEIEKIINSGKSVKTKITIPIERL